MKIDCGPSDNDFDPEEAINKWLTNTLKLFSSLLTGDFVTKLSIWPIVHELQYRSELSEHQTHS